MVQRTLNWLYAFQVANQPSRVEEPKQLWWLLPSDQWFKLNVDGTVKLKEGVGGAGGVIRWEGGGFRAVGVWRFQGIASIKQVELFVVREGLQLAKTLGSTHIAEETDAMEAVAACMDRYVDLSSLSFIARDIHEMTARFEGRTISYVPRGCNKMAHCLSKSSSYSRDSLF